MASSHPSSRLAATFPHPFSSSLRKSSTHQEEQPNLSLRGLLHQEPCEEASVLLVIPSKIAPGGPYHLNTMTNTIAHDHQPQQEQAPVVRPQMKKQARRRTHVSRPYQERLLNMAEARREIVTALKIHRANMRQQPTTYQHQADTLLRQSPSLLLRQQEQQQQQQVQVVFQDRSQAVEEEAPLLAPTSYAAFADHQLCNPLAHWIAAAAPAGSYYYSSPVLPYDLTPLEVPTAMGGLEWHGLENLARSLPAQPLGLNLSFQGFGGGSVEFEDVFGVPLIQSTSPDASSYSAYSPPATEMASGTHGHGSPALSSTAEKYTPADAPAAALIPVLDDGETQRVEWGEASAADVAASAWWSKVLLESMESGGGEVSEGGAVGCVADDAVAAAGLPAEWRCLCDSGVGDGDQGAATVADKPPDVLETMPADGDYYNHCYEGGHHRSNDGDGITLPCMDDIEGWDGEWFSCSSS